MDQRQRYLHNTKPNSKPTKRNRRKPPVDATGSTRHYSTESKWYSVNDLLMDLSQNTGTPKQVLTWLRNRLKGTRVEVHASPEFPRDSRVLLSADRFIGNGLRQQVERECNGVILDLDTRRALAVPPPSFRYLRENDRDQEIMRALKTPGVQIFEAVDGTILTLYQYRGRACLGSSRRIDIGDSRWVGPRTYAEVVGDCIQIDQLPVDALADWSITLLLSHKEFHPLADGTELLVVQAHNLRTGAMHLPTGEEDDPTWNTLCQLPVQVETEVDMTHQDDFLASMKRVADNALSEFQSRHVAKFGYIIRAPSRPALFLESSLMRTLRQYLYMPIPPKITDNNGNAVVIDNKNRLQYLSLHAYLGFYGSEYITQIDPRFEPEFKKLKELFDPLYGEILDHWAGVQESERAGAVIDLILRKKLEEHLTREYMEHDTRVNQLLIVKSLLMDAIRNRESNAMDLMFWMFASSPA